MPFDCLERSTDRRAIHTIARIAREEGVERLVLGEPRAVDGSLGPAAERVHRFAAKLRRVTGLPLDLVTETLTTVEAERRLRDQAPRQAQKQASIDALAAQIILQEALERSIDPTPMDTNRRDIDPQDPCPTQQDCETEQPT